MSIQRPKYDVAISFLVQDLLLAQALYDKLTEGLNVFFFPHSQEELAGTDGLESMREPFLDQSRMNMVLYRERWGHTPWTGVEAAAIKDSCLATCYRSLFFFVVEPTSVLPVWLPDTHVRFNYCDLPLEQAVGALKLRVQERGGHYTPLTPLKKANLLEAENLYRSDRSAMNSAKGLEIILSEVKLLFAEIEKQCADVNAATRLKVRCEAQCEERSSYQSCLLSNDRVGLVVSWHQRYTGMLENSGLSIVEYNGRLLMHSEVGHHVLAGEPDRIAEMKYEPELSRSREYGWKKIEESKSFITSAALAEKCVLQFLELADRAAGGKLGRPSHF